MKVWGFQAMALLLLNRYKALEVEEEQEDEVVEEHQFEYQYEDEFQEKVEEDVYEVESEEFQENIEEYVYEDEADEAEAFQEKVEEEDEAEEMQELQGIDKGLKELLEGLNFSWLQGCAGQEEQEDQENVRQEVGEEALVRTRTDHAS